MTVPHQRPGRSAASMVIRIVAIIVSLAAAIVFVFCGWLVVSSRFGLTETDVHGYGLIFGSILAVAASFVVAAVLPQALPRHRRNLVYAFSMLFFVIVLVLAIAAVVTA